MGTDLSNGWDAIAPRFIASRSSIGADVARHWSARLPIRAIVLDLGCGFGEPISRVLVEGGHTVFAIDASPELAAELRRRLPMVTVACEAVELFGRTFDAVCAVGLLFLLPTAAQRRVMDRVGRVLPPGGRFLFSSPLQRCRWRDLQTGRLSRSLGEAAYNAALAETGMAIVQHHEDEGGNHYFEAERR